MKKILVILHLCAILLILIDNTIIFKFLKKNSNYIKEKFGSVLILRKLTSTVILDFEYRKPKIKNNDICKEKENNREKIINIIGERRARQQDIFFNQYRDNSILSNTVLLADFVHEFMRNRIDTLYLPFSGSNYCYNFMNTEWCQVASFDLFVFPIKTNMVNYKPELDLDDYLRMKELSRIEICGSEGIIFHLLFDEDNTSRNNYYFFVYGNEVFISIQN